MAKRMIPNGSIGHEEDTLLFFQISARKQSCFDDDNFVDFDFKQRQNFLTFECKKWFFYSDDAKKDWNRSN